VAQNHLLGIGFHPTGHKHRLAAWIVKPGGLFGVKADQKFLEVEVRTNHAEGLERRFLAVNLLGGILGAEVVPQVAVYVAATDDLLLQLLLNGQSRKSTHLAQNGVGGVECRLRFLRRRSLRGVSLPGERGRAGKEYKGDRQQRVKL
jgi:hypothetical protein